MSGPNAALALPRDERPPALQPQPQLQLDDNPVALSGVQLELAAIGKKWDDVNMLVGRLLADANFANTQKQLASLEATTDQLYTAIGSAAALALHARKAVTARRVQNRKDI